LKISIKFFEEYEKFTVFFLFKKKQKFFSFFKQKRKKKPFSKFSFFLFLDFEEVFKLHKKPETTSHSKKSCFWRESFFFVQEANDSIVFKLAFFPSTT
jgi:hypothetical protein